MSGSQEISQLVAPEITPLTSRKKLSVWNVNFVNIPFQKYHLSGKLEITYPLIGNRLKSAWLLIILWDLVSQGLAATGDACSPDKSRLIEYHVFADFYSSESWFPNTGLVMENEPKYSLRDTQDALDVLKRYQYYNEKQKPFILRF